jgi:hypothetical protein
MPRIIWLIIAPWAGNARSEPTSDPKNTHRNAVVDLAFGIWAILANVVSLGRRMASLQTETHSETPDGGGSMGALVGSFISTSKSLFYYCTKQRELQPVKRRKTIDVLRMANEAG